MAEHLQIAKSKDRWRHLGLLVAFLVLFVVTPIAASFRFGIVVINIVGASVLLSAVYAVSYERRLFRLTVALAVFSVAANALVLVYQIRGVVVVAHCTVLLLLSLFAFSILSYVLRGGAITADKIYAAICVYFLIGYAWAFAYALLETVNPGSFSGLQTDHIPDPSISRVIQLRYFSFVTLTTVGYGDILPRSGGARTMATLEAIMGQLYLAVLVARLVGLHIVESMNSRR